jgi:small subunit ribosomal protein S17
MPAKQIKGIVTRAGVDKTVAVNVERKLRHPVYHKVIRRSRTYLVQDDIGVSVGDVVAIVEAIPISKRKRFRVQAIIKGNNKS